MAQNVVLVTTMGEITVELYTEHAPKVITPLVTNLDFGNADSEEHRLVTTFPHWQAEATTTARPSIESSLLS